MSFRKIPLSKIQDDPIKKNDVAYTGASKQALADMAKSIEAFGLLHPIVVTRKGEDQYIVLAGRKRLSAVKILKWNEVDCSVLEDLTPPQRRGIMISENLWRTPIKKATLLLAVQEFWKLHTQVEAERNGVESVVVPAATPAEPEAPASTPKPSKSPQEKRKDRADFVGSVADQTNKSRTQAYRLVKVAETLTQDQLTALEAVDATEEAMVRLASVKDAETRDRAVNLVAAGAEVEDAIDKATPEGERDTHSNGLEDDEKYTAKYCSALYESLKRQNNAKALVASVGLYRRIADDRVAFRKKAAPFAVEYAKRYGGKKAGPFVTMVGRLCTVTHPRDWLLCVSCKGSGIPGPGTERSPEFCPSCMGHGFRMNFDQAM